MAQRAVMPPPVAGTRPATARDSFRLAGWMLRGFVYGIAHGEKRSRVMSGLSLFGAASGLLALLFALFVLHRWQVPALTIAVVMSALIPVLIWAQIVVARSTVWYVIDGAAMAVIASERGWTIANHLSAHPGSGAGRRLRDLVFPRLIAQADRHGIDILVEAADARLADIYRSEIPGLVAVGPAALRGVKLRRQPNSEPEPHRHKST